MSFKVGTHLHYNPRHKVIDDDSPTKICSSAADKYRRKPGEFAFEFGPGYFFDVILMIFNLGRAFLFAKLSLQPDSCGIKRLDSFLLFPLHYVNSNKEERVIITYLQLTIIELFDCKINDRVKLMLDLACEAFEAWHGQIFL